MQSFPLAHAPAASGALKGGAPAVMKNLPYGALWPGEQRPPATGGRSIQSPRPRPALGLRRRDDLNEHRLGIGAPAERQRDTA